MKALVFSLFVALIVGGCASRPTQQEMSTADYGSYPSNYEQIIRILHGDLLELDD